MNSRYNPGDIVLGNWKLIRLIDEGACGRVFEAEREDFGVVYKAAIKIITIPQSRSEIDSARAEGMNDESVTAYLHGFVEDLVREISLMSRLKSTANIVSYEDHTVVQHNDSLGWDIIIRMELLTPLLKHTEGWESPRHEIIQLGIDICRALELCQKNNIVHRDIKPENIFASALGGYKLGDFGIARTVEKTMSGLTTTGTRSYMAPEVFLQKPYGPGVDIYSLGIVLYTLLNDNRTPFLPLPPAPIVYSDRQKAFDRRISGEPLPNPRNADGRLAEIVLKACAYEPKDRYSSPTEMRQELEALRNRNDRAASGIPALEDTEIIHTSDNVVTSVSSGENGTKQSQVPFKNHKIINIVTGIVCAAIVIWAAVFFFVMPNLSDSPPDVSASDNTTSSPASDQTPKPTPEPSALHEHVYDDIGFCTCNEEFPIEIMSIPEKVLYAVKDDVPVRSRPYGDDATSKLESIAKGTEVSIVGSAYNSFGNLWYVLNDGNWIFNENLSITEPKATPTTDGTHTHEYDNIGYCACGEEFPLDIMTIPQKALFTIKDDVPIRTRPYGDDKSAKIGVYAKGTEVTVVGTAYNSAGNLWYVLDDGSWIFNENLTITKPS